MQSIRLIAISLLGFTAAAAVADEHGDDRLKAAIEAEQRPAAEAARDGFRNPYETLKFFGIRPDMTVVELSPGGGWYTEILGPYLKDEGRLIAAHFNLDREDAPGYFQVTREAWEARVADQARFGRIELVPFDPPALSDLGEPGTADLVVSFRNVHGWKHSGVFDDVLASAHSVLRQGGVLGVVGHRLPADMEQDPEVRSGYVHQSWVVARAEANGFRLVETSEINANPSDTADHPNGVWTLPPSLRVPEGEDEERYRAIGESDRFTLKFVKR